MRVRDAGLISLGAVIGAAACYLILAKRPINDSELLIRLKGRPELIADQAELLEQVRVVLRTRALTSRGNERVRLLSGKWAWASEVAFAPSLGNLQAPHTIIEFTDYTCIPCRGSASVIQAIVRQNRDVRVAVLFLPTGGPVAEYAARVAYAAYRQNPALFARLHQQLMLAANGDFTQETILAAARSCGYDIEQMERELSASESRKFVESSRQLARDLQITGVPAFAAGATLIMGGVDMARLNDLVSAARVRRPNPNESPPWSPSAGKLSAPSRASLAGSVTATSGTDVHPPRPFRLVDQDGQVATDETFRGSWVALIFGFTHCPDVCPATLVRLSAALRRIGPGGGHVRIVFVTVDPQRDTPAELSKYVSAFGSDITALTGGSAEIAAVLRTFGAYAAKQPPAGDGSYSVDHSSLIYLLDPNGRLSRQLTSGTPADTLALIFRSLP